MSSYLKGLIKASGDEYASIVADGIVGNSNTHYVDTGCYALNALISGNLFHGLPSNRALLLAGEESTGKTFYALEMVYHFLKDNPEADVIYFDTEKSLDEGMFNKRGIDSSRVAIMQPKTIEEFRTYATRVIDKIETIPEEGRPRVLFVLDSMGMLSSEAETQNMLDGKNVADMKKAGLWRATFRVLTLRMGLLNIPMVTVGHTYANIGNAYAGRVVAGGGGAKYSASTIITLTKAKEKEGTEQVGVIISATAYKSRQTREGTKVKTKLLFDKGLDRYSGLLEMAEMSGVFQKKTGGRYITPENEKAIFGKHIKEDPEAYFTKEVMDQINVWVKENMTLGGTKRDLTDLDVED